MQHPKLLLLFCNLSAPLLFEPAMTDQRKLLVLVLSNTYMCDQNASVKIQKNSLLSILNSYFLHYVFDQLKGTKKENISP